MPRGDGTGPAWGGGGRGGGGRGGGMGGGGRGGGGGPLSAGPGGFCVCPSCGQRAPHQRGVPCNNLKCPKCGQPMARE